MTSLVQFFWNNLSRPSRLKQKPLRSTWIICAMLFSLFDPSTCRIWWRFYWDSSSMRSLQFVPAAWPCRRIYLGRSVVPYWERTAASNSLNHVGLTTQLRLVCGTIFTPKGLDVRPGIPLASLGLRLFCVAGVVLNHLIHSHTQTHSLTNWLTHSLIHWLTHSLSLHEHTYIHTNSPTITAPSLLYFLFPSCFSMIRLSLKKLETCGVIRSFIVVVMVVVVVAVVVVGLGGRVGITPAGVVVLVVVVVLVILIVLLVLVVAAVVVVIVVLVVVLVLVLVLLLVVVLHGGGRVEVVVLLGLVLPLQLFVSVP